MVSVFEVTTYVNGCPFNHWLEEFKDGALANFGDVANKRKRQSSCRCMEKLSRSFVIA